MSGTISFSLCYYFFGFPCRTSFPLRPALFCSDSDFWSSWHKSSVTHWTFFRHLSVVNFFENIFSLALWLLYLLLFHQFPVSFSAQIELLQRHRFLLKHHFRVLYKHWRVFCFCWPVAELRSLLRCWRWSPVSFNSHLNLTATGGERLRWHSAMTVSFRLTLLLVRKEYFRRQSWALSSACALTNHGESDAEQPRLFGAQVDVTVFVDSWTMTFAAVSLISSLHKYLHHTMFHLEIFKWRMTFVINFLDTHCLGKFDFTALPRGRVWPVAIINYEDFDWLAPRRLARFLLTSQF